MSDRERLIELMQKCDIVQIQTSKFIEGFADYLLEHGVIVLPCKAGDTVYYITGIGHNLIKSAKIKEIIIDKNGIKDLYVQGDGHNFENSFDIFFLTREEAEQALKERDGSCSQNKIIHFIADRGGNNAE